MQEKIYNTIKNSIDGYNSLGQGFIDISNDELFNDNGQIDSLGLVSFIVMLEKNIKKDIGKDITLANEKINERDIYPFSKISALNDYVSSELSKDYVYTPKKVVIVDLDNTMWDGVVGDSGIGGIQILDRHIELQRALKKLSSSGVLLAISSKNNEKIAIDAINNKDGMLLGIEAFVTHRINWNNKADNIRTILDELNLGQESAVFIDDDPREREVVASLLPGVTVLESIDLSLFNTGNLTQEDKHRLQMYKLEKDRQKAKDAFQSIDEWLDALGMTISILKVEDDNFSRTLQLLNKTNQMNLATRRMTKQQLHKWLERPDTETRVVSVEDKFGDSGITGIISFVPSLSSLFIYDFVLSCRVMGRGIEEILMHLICQYAMDNKIEKVKLMYVETERNLPCLEFLRKSWLSSNDDVMFAWNTGTKYNYPKHIAVRGNI